MPGISLHAVDVAGGMPATGMAVEIVALAAGETPIASGVIGADGALAHDVVRTTMAPGVYEARFHIGAFYRASGRACGFLDVVPFRFTVTDPQEHLHLPIKFTPFGYALFRGV